MRLLRNFWGAFKEFFTSFPFIFQNQLGHFFLIALFSAAGLWLSWYFVNTSINDWMVRIVSDGLSSIGVWEWTPSWLQSTLLDIVDWSVWLILIWLQIKLFKFVVLFVLSPLMSAVATKTYGKLNPSHETGNQSLLKQVFRGMGAAILFTSLEWFFVAILFLLSFLISTFIPVLLPILVVFPIISGGISAWFYGAVLTDYSCELKGLSPTQSLRLSWKNFGRVLGLGLPFYILMSVPILSWFFGPVIGVVTCVVASMKLWHNQSSEFQRQR
ncbi:MAG: EI24 domain-containing protein [Bacteroidetes bacterium]|nr:EI24 domain-containing protein [Bacteroidota bacterium]MDA1336766.1 EI24 domain-containing protein [Bacteroidota bacterium]